MNKIERPSCEKIVELYISQNKTFLEVCELLHTSKDVLRKALKEYHIRKPGKLRGEAIKKAVKLKYNVSNVSQLDSVKRKTKIPRPDRDTLEELYINQNMSRKEISKKLSVTLSTLGTFLREFNIKKPIDKTIKLKQKTCFVKYGDKGYNNISKRKKTCLQKYGVENVCELDYFLEKRRKSLKGRYGVDCYLKTKDFQEKQYVSKSKNNSWTKSSSEINLYNNLVKIFGEKNIFWQYRDVRYPFNCDFYIKPLDMFIELNLHIAHGRHPFDSSSPEDLKTLSIWISRCKKRFSKKQNKEVNNSYYDFIKTWTIRDPYKQKIAKENNLNYKVLYNKKDIEKLLEEFYA